MTKRWRITLRFLVYQEGEYWFAHCLELDIVAEAKSPVEAMADVLTLIILQIKACEGDLDSIWHPAPADLWSKYSVSQKDIPSADIPIPTDLIDHVEARELVLA